MATASDGADDEVRMPAFEDEWREAEKDVVRASNGRFSGAALHIPAAAVQAATICQMDIKSPRRCAISTYPASYIDRGEGILGWCTRCVRGAYSREIIEVDEALIQQSFNGFEYDPDAPHIYDTANGAGASTRSVRYSFRHGGWTPDPLQQCPACDMPLDGKKLTAHLEKHHGPEDFGLTPSGEP